MKSLTSLISFRNAVGVMLALSAVLAVVLSTMVIPGEDAEADSGNAEAWWNQLDDSERVGALFGSEEGADTPRAKAAQGMYAELDASTRKLVDDQWKFIYNMDTSQDVMSWWDSLDCSQMKAVVGFYSVQQQGNYCLQFSELTRTQKLRVHNLGLAILGLEASADAPQTAAWWGELDSGQMVNVVYGNPALKGDGSTPSVDEGGRFQKGYNALDGNSEAPIPSEQLPEALIELLDRAEVGEGPYSAKQIVDGLADVLFYSLTSDEGGGEGTAGGEEGDEEGGEGDDAPALLGFSSVQAWWNTLDCQLRRLAVGEDNEDVDSVTGEKSVYCTAYPDGSDGSDELSEELKEELKEVKERIDAVGMALLGLSDADGTDDATPDVASGGLISRIEPAIRGVTVSGGDKVALSVGIYGLQNVRDQSLGDGVTFDWSEGDNSIDGSGSEIMYTAPSSPGTYMIKASIDASDCSPSDASMRDSACSAEFEVRVRRPSAPQPTEEAPVNPPGEIPGILADSDGNQYEVFTPVEGGMFSGEGYSLNVAAGAVPNGEFIGIRMSDEGAASNVGMTHQRYTLGGNMYGVHAVDSSGASISSYVLDDPATVCLPLPDELRTDISDLAVVAINGDGSLTILSAQVRISATGTMVCGGLSGLPASVAVGSAGAPAAIPTPTPEPEPEPPVTGGTAPASSAVVLWSLLLGIAVLTLGSVLVIGRRKGVPK